MKTHGENFIVQYDKGSIRNYDLGSGIVIEIAAECNMDIRGNSDQIGTIVSAPADEKFFKDGDTVLTHYLASADSGRFSYGGQDYYKVTKAQMFAKIHEDGELEPAEDIYFCSDIVVDSTTESGILTTIDGKKNELLRLVITHIPSSINKMWADDKINVGDVIMPFDNYNYRFTYNKKEYVKIEHKFISGVYSMLPNTIGKIFANTVQKLNRNVSFLAKNQYYEAAIGPFGEELQYRTTTSEPGTAEAYLETMVNPFSSRTYKGGFTLTPKQIEQEKALYRRSMNIHTTMVNLALAYAELTGSEYVIEFEGKKMDLMSLIADQMKNEFTFSTGDTRKQQAMSEIRQTYSAKYSLPMSVYRAELKRRGELKFYAMQNVENAVNNGVIATAQSYIRQNNLFMAQQTIENFFNLYAKARSGANANYEKDFKNRERNILEEMRRQGVIKKEEYEKLVGIGGK